MLVCHCNVITEAEIAQVVRAFLAADPWAVVVPAKVYREMGKRGRCCGCFPNVVDIISKVTEDYHRQAADIAPPQATAVPHRVSLGSQYSGDVIEGSARGHRAA